MDRSPDPEQISQLELKLRAAALNERKAALDELAMLPAEAANSIFELGAAAIPELQRLFERSDN